MHLHVVGVPVATLRVVRREHVSPLVTQDHGESARHRFHVLLGEPGPHVITRHCGFRKPAVGIAEQHHAFDAESPSRCVDLAEAHATEVGVAPVVRVRQPRLTGRSHDQHDPMAGGG